MSTENALVSLLREGVSVQESSVDSERDPEDALRSACNDFIEHTSKSVAGVLLSLLDKTKSVGNKVSLLQVDSIEIVLKKTLDGLEE